MERIWWYLCYDVNDNLIKDLNRNIIDIQYNVLNLPSKVIFGDGNLVSHKYVSDGKKLQAVYTIIGLSLITDYIGDIICENRTLKSILVDGGYYENNECYFYIDMFTYSPNVYSPS